MLLWACWPRPPASRLQRCSRSPSSTVQRGGEGAQHGPNRSLGGRGGCGVAPAPAVCRDGAMRVLSPTPVHRAAGGGAGDWQHRAAGGELGSSSALSPSVVTPPPPPLWCGASAGLVTVGCYGPMGHARGPCGCSGAGAAPAALGEGGRKGSRGAFCGVWGAAAAAERLQHRDHSRGGAGRVC